MHFIELGNSVPVASGSTRDVYLHPDDDGLLIKVVPAGVIERRYVRGRAWFDCASRRRRRGAWIMPQNLSCLICTPVRAAQTSTRIG